MPQGSQDDFLAGISFDKNRFGMDAKGLRERFERLFPFLSGLLDTCLDPFLEAGGVIIGRVARMIFRISGSIC
jgi:hypothetical protein